MTGIYKITNLTTGDFYIGKSKHIEKRFKEHFCKGYGAYHSKLFQEHIDQYGKSGFAFEVIEQCAESELHERESYYISKLSPTYNTILIGHIVSVETRLKISKSLSGRKQSKEIVEKRCKALRERYKLYPKTNEKHKKPVRCENENVIFESVLALAEHLKVHPSTVTKALKRNGKVKGQKVWYVV